MWLLVVLGVVMWLWALFLYQLGLFPSLEAAIYFTSVAFTTLGFGDITLSIEWRLLSGMVATNGFILFGLGTAFLFEAIIRFRNLRLAQSR